jgi:hypothetical protein
MAVAVTYLADSPDVAVPFPMTADRVWRPLRTGVPVAVLLVSVAAVVVAAFRYHLRQTLPQRSRRHLDTPDEPTPEFVEFFQGVYRPLDSAPSSGGGCPGEGSVVGHIERTGWPATLQMTLCIATYYGVALLVWSCLLVLPADAAQPAPPWWGMALAMSPLVLPVLLVTLAIPCRPRTVFAATAAAAAVTAVLIRLASPTTPAPSASAVLQQVPWLAFAGWALPVWATIAVERSRRIRDWLRLDLPVRADGQVDPPPGSRRS